MTNRVFFWWIFGSCFVSLASVSVIAPAVYILTLALLACVGVLIGTGVATFALLDSGPFGWLFAGDIAKLGIELTIAIMRAAAGAGSND